MAKPGISLPVQAEQLGLYGRDIGGKTLGIAGFGKIGRKVAQKMHDAFDMKILAYDPYANGSLLPEGYAWCETLDELMAQSDYISLHMPGGASTKNLVGARELGLMKPTAYIVNCARGGIINDEALYEALRSHRIAGAAVDVFDRSLRRPISAFSNATTSS
jgi:D-3-phosphoglycerate dehydrogenase